MARSFMPRCFRFIKPVLVASFLVFVLFSLLCTADGLSAEKTIGVILPGDASCYRDIHLALMARLQRDNYSQKVEVIVQKPFPDPVSLSNAARKLIALDVDLIVTYGVPSALAVFREKARIPVVASCIHEPSLVEGRVKNATIVSAKTPVPSLLRYLRGMVPIATLGVVYSSGDDDSTHQMRELLRLSEQYGFKVDAINLKRPQDAKQVLSGRKFDAILMTASPVAQMASPAITEYSRSQRIPSAALFYDNHSPATISLGVNAKEQGERTAERVIMVLNGISPEKLKGDASSSTELIFNLKEATTMGWKIPMDLVTEATRLIQ